MKAVPCYVLVLVLAALPAVAVKQEAKTSSALTFDAAAAKEYPVSKVVTLLKDMLKQLEKEAEEDEEIYDKLACWCTTNDKEKTEAIAEAEAQITALTNKISELTALSASLTTEIKNTKAEKEANEEALAKADALRQKELAEFNAEEKDALESLAALKAAITVIGQHHSSLLQLSDKHLAGVAKTLQQNLQKHAFMFAELLTHSQTRALKAFIQKHNRDYFDAAPTFKQSYAPESGQIYGILTQMKETFENNLSASQKEEMAAEKAFQELKAAKEKQIADLANKLDRKTEQLADTDQANAQAEEDLENTKSSLAADEEYLLTLKEKCAMTDAEWEKRQATRSNEMEAVSKAISILNADESHDLFSKTFNPTFVQKESLMNTKHREDAAKLLSAAARKSNNPRLAQLAVKVRLDAFTKVKKAIDDMVAQLMKEKADEIKLKDYCVEEFFQSKMQKDKLTRDKTLIENAIAELEMHIEELTKEIDSLKAKIEADQAELKKAGEARAEENKDFKETVADQTATVKVLTSALGVLEGFYGKMAFVQRKEPVGPPPPPGFTEYKNNAGSKGVMDLLASIIADATAMTADAERAEKEAQEAYDAFAKETQECIEKDSEQVINLSEDKAKAEKDLVAAEDDNAATELALENLANSVTELHQACDFTMKNFEVRQKARDEEVEALKQAKAILSGADFQAFLQSGP